MRNVICPYWGKCKEESMRNSLLAREEQMKDAWSAEGAEDTDGCPEGSVTPTDAGWQSFTDPRARPSR